MKLCGNNNLMALHQLNIKNGTLFWSSVRTKFMNKIVISTCAQVVLIKRCDEVDDQNRDLYMHTSRNYLRRESLNFATVLWRVHSSIYIYIYIILHIFHRLRLMPPTPQGHVGPPARGTLCACEGDPPLPGLGCRIEFDPTPP